MYHLAVYTAISLAVLGTLPAEAQTRTLRRSGEDVLILNVRPRSYRKLSGPGERLRPDAVLPQPAPLFRPARALRRERAARSHRKRALSRPQHA
jgi:hypothetical protein